MISERALKQWRRAALVFKPIPSNEQDFQTLVKENLTLRSQVIRLTQALSDLILIQKGR